MISKEELEGLILELEGWTSHAVRERAKSYIGNITRIDIDDDGKDRKTTRIDSVVQGTKPYSVTFLIAPKYKEFASHCDCPYDWDEICKHRLAVLYYLRTHFSKYEKITNKSLFLETPVYNVYSQQNFKTEEAVKIKIYADIFIPDMAVGCYNGYYHRDRDYYLPCLQLRVSLDNPGSKDYRVSKIHDFIKTFTELKHDNVYTLGKNLLISQRTHSFDKMDSDLIMKLGELLERYPRYSFHDAIRTNKSILLNRNIFNFLIDALINHPRLYFGKSSSPVRFCKVSPEYYLNKSKKDYQLSLEFIDENSNKMIPGKQTIIWGEYGKIWLLDKEKNTIYLLDNKNISEILKDCKELQSACSVSFGENDLAVFFHELYPVLRDNHSVKIDEAIQIPTVSDFSDKFEIDISLDKCSKNVFLKPMIQADFKEIMDGKAAIETRHRYYKVKNDEYVVLAANIFEKLDEILKPHYFSKNDNVYTLKSDGGQFLDFVFEGLPALQNNFKTNLNFNPKDLNILDARDIVARIDEHFHEGELDFFEINFNIENIVLSPDDILKILKSSEKYYKLKGGAVLNAEQLKSKLGNLNEDIPKFYCNQIPLNQSYFICRQLQNNGIKVVETDNLRTIIKRLEGSEPVPEIALPQDIKSILRHYQVEGVFWLNYLHNTGFAGILADDMGLGKTVQILTLLNFIKKELSSLVVCPTSLVYNWQNEINKFYPNMKTGIIYGSREERLAIINDYSQYDILITSYPMLRRDIENYNGKKFEFVILDEAQFIKNANTQIAACVKRIRSKNRFVLTGTPLENNLAELWSIFDFVMPGFFPEKAKFKELYEMPIKNNDLASIKKLSFRVKPFILRRLKKDVLRELPDKVENYCYCDLTEEQKRLYLSVLEVIKDKLSQTVKLKGFDRSRIEILSALTKLRQICCHPSLLEENYAAESGKMKLLNELVLEAINGGHKILLFSQFVSMLKIIEKELIKSDIKYEFLYGATKNRIEMVSRFNDDANIKIFLLSLKAGGTGLNLTSADVVIHYDPWWNPAVEDQATDRCYRIGQENKVNVYKLITKGTIEEKILALQKRKKDLIDKIITPNISPIDKLTWEDFKQLLDIN